MVSFAPIVNRLDKERLQTYLAGSAALAAYRLKSLLESAKAVRPTAVPRNVVTMNSHLVLRDPLSDSVERCILAYPDAQDGDGPAISVLSPLGAALLAAREGQEVTYHGARAPRRVVIEDLVYQPERAGDLDL